MGESNTNTVNWWAVAHVVTILGQFSVCLTGAVTFAIGQPRRWDNHTPSDDEFWDDVTTSSTLPWISSAVGAFTTVLSIIVFTILHKAYKASSAHMLDNQDSQKDVFRNAVIGVTVALSLVVMADIAIAVNTGLSGLTAICGAASTASILVVDTIFANLFRLRQSYKERKKHQYVIELAEPSEEGTPAGMGPPPSYEAAVAAPK